MGAEKAEAAPPSQLLLLEWAASTVLATFAVAFADLLLVVVASPAAASRPVGAVQTWALSVAAMLPAGALVTLVLGALDRPEVRARIPPPARIAAALPLAAAAAAALAALDRVREEASEEFAAEPRRAALVAAAVVVLSVVALAPAVERAAARWLASGWAREGARLGRLLGAAGAVVLVDLSHHAFGPLHLLKLAALCLVGAVALTSVALRGLVRVREPRDAGRVIGLGLAVALFGVAWPGGREHARFFLMNHSAAAGVAEALRDLVDLDGDGAAATWLGGTDCREGDPRVGPVLREVPGDGVDQDCRGGDAPGTPAVGPASLPEGCRAQPRSVVILVVDALRADAAVAEVMPNVAALAARSWVFERAYAPTAMTLTSVSAIFGAGPLSDVGADNPLVDGALTAPKTLAERFAAAGFRTAAMSDFLEHPLHRRGFAVRNPQWRDLAARGVKDTLTSAATARGVLEHLGAAEGPAFTWAHFSDSHARYKLDRHPDGSSTSAREAYVRGVAYVDQQLGVLLGGLAAQGLAERTILVVTADHGEELGDHGREGHGPHLYEESVRVPLIVHVPGCDPLTWHEPVSVARLGPTLGAATGVEVPGRGLFDAPGAPVVIEAATGLTAHFKRAIVLGTHKLVVDAPNGGAVLFDLARDPGETDAVDDPAVRAELEAAYQAWLDAPGAR